MPEATVTIPKGIYFGTSQEEADGYAMNAACTQAESELECPGGPPPAINCELEQDWPTVPDGTPYSFEVFEGSMAVEGGLFGGVGPTPGAPLQFLYNFPIHIGIPPEFINKGLKFPVVVGDFVSSVEWSVTDTSTEGAIGFVVYDNNEQGFVFYQSYGAITGFSEIGVNWFCTLQSMVAYLDGDNADIEITPNGPVYTYALTYAGLSPGNVYPSPGVYQQIQIQRIGSIFRFYLDGVERFVFDCGSEVKMNIGIVFSLGDSLGVGGDFYFQNLTIA